MATCIYISCAKAIKSIKRSELLLFSKRNYVVTSYSSHSTKRKKIHNFTNNISDTQYNLFSPILHNARLFSSEKTLNVDLTKIPDPPSIPEKLVEVVATSEDIPLSALGLGGWTPVGMVQQCLEYLHITMGIPWWGTIVIGTLVVRTVLFPLVIAAQRNSAKMNNILPQVQLLQLKMTEARQTGNAIAAAQYGQEIALYMREKGVNPLKNMIVPLAQAPIFISFFMALRGMANTPVDSMRNGGLFWFTDLTVADPYFLLPIITSATLLLTIEVGTDSARLSAQNMHVMKYVLRCLPIVIFPFIMNFPGAILCYWASSNFISLGQVSLLKIPKVRNYFGIDRLITHTPESLPSKKKGFVEGVKDSWQNMKITKEIEERQRIDEILFAKAGRGPLVKTYKYNPIKAHETVIGTKEKNI